MAAIVANRTMKPPTVVSTKLRFLNRNNGISACFDLLSATANSTASSTVAAMSPIIIGLSHAYSTPPHEVAKVSVHTAAAINVMPQKSKFFSDSRLRYVGSSTADTTMATTESGILIQNAQRQLTKSVNTPPRSGPTSMGNAQPIPITFRYSARLRAGTMSATMACESTMEPPPPKPATARPAISKPISVAAPHMIDPTKNSTCDRMNNPFRPIMSPTLP